MDKTVALASQLPTCFDSQEIIQETSSLVSRLETQKTCLETQLDTWSLKLSRIKSQALSFED